MSIATALAAELDRMHMRQEDLANRTNFSRQSVTAWCNGDRRIPDEAKAELARTSPRVALELCAACPANLFTAGWLDGEEVDLGIMATTMKLAEELEEFADALKGLKLVNKNSPKALTDADKQALQQARQEAFDVLTGIQTWLVRGAQVYGLALHEEADKHRMKLVAREYKKNDRR